MRHHHICVEVIKGLDLKDDYSQLKESIIERCEDLFNNVILKKYDVSKEDVTVETSNEYRIESRDYVVTYTFIWN